MRRAPCPSPESRERKLASIMRRVTAVLQSDNRGPWHKAFVIRNLRRMRRGARELPVFQPE